MLYCRRCNNTHWKRIAPKTVAERLLILGLKRQYLCLKCNKVTVASIFADIDWHRSKSKKPKKAKSNPTVKCPKCDGETRRSRRKGFERLVPFMRAYRCEK